MTVLLSLFLLHGNRVINRRYQEYFHPRSKYRYNQHFMLITSTCNDAGTFWMRNIKPSSEQCKAVWTLWHYGSIAGAHYNRVFSSNRSSRNDNVICLFVSSLSRALFFISLTLSDSLWTSLALSSSLNLTKAWWCSGWHSGWCSGICSSWALFLHLSSCLSISL